jgi:hypothetical protein
MLVMTNVSDIDITTVNGTEIGRTGFLFGKMFYAAFLPRFYSLNKLADQESPTISVQCWGVIGAGAGVRFDPKEVKIISQDDSLSEYFLLLFSPFSQILLVIGVAISAFPMVRSRKNDGWQWNPKALTAFYCGALLFNLTMTKTWRFIVPSLISKLNFYCLHGLGETFAIWGIAELIRTAQFTDKTAIEEFKIKNKTMLKALGGTNVAAALVSAGLVVWGASDNIKVWHARAVLLQAILALTVLLVRFTALDIPKTRKRALPASIIFLTIQTAAVLVLIRDATIYMWMHKPGEKYYVQYFFLAVLLAGAFRERSLQHAERLAKAFSDNLRTRLRDISNGRDQLENICKSIEEEWQADRVTVTSIKGEEAVILTSTGNQARTHDTTPKAIGPLLRLLKERIRPIYVPDQTEFNQDLKHSGYSNSCFLVPFVQKGEVVAAISVMVKEGSKLSPYKSRLLHSSSLALESEVTGAIGNAILEQSRKQLKEFAVGMSGLVFEHMNEWGQLQKDNPPARRVVLSADGLKTTCLDQVGVQSPLLFALLKEYRAEVYAGWIAIKQAFDLVSSDVHGDDFWVVSPLKFKDPELVSLGAEKVVLIAACLIEEHSRVVSSKPEYRALARFGSHVAVGAGMIELVALGITDSMCPDIHGYIMSRMHRIRSEADPGSVLVDLEDPAVKHALTDENLFITRNFDGPIAEAAFKDLHVRPSIAMLIGLRENKLLTRKRNHVTQMVADSPYITKLESQKKIA